jgi:hypothetical protein
MKSNSFIKFISLLNFLQLVTLIIFIMYLFNKGFLLYGMIGLPLILLVEIKFLLQVYVWRKK